MAAEYFEAAEPYYLHAQALEPSEMRWPYYLGHVYMARAEPAKAIASFERALALATRRCGDAGVARRRAPRSGPARVGRAAVHARAVDSTAHGGGALRPGPGGAGETRVLARRRSVRAGAGGGSARVDRPLPARACVSGTGRHGAGRSAPASAGQRGGRSAGSVDGGVTRIAARRGGRRESRHSRARQRRLQDGSGPFPQGRRAGAGQPVDQAQARQRRCR